MDYSKINIIKDNIHPTDKAYEIRWRCEDLDIPVPSKIYNIIEEYDEKLKEISKYLISLLPKAFQDYVKEHDISLRGLSTDVHRLSINLIFRFFDGDNYCTICFIDGTPSICLNNWGNAPKDGFKIIQAIPSGCYYFFDK